MQCSKKRWLDDVISFSTDQSVFCDLQEFFHVNFQIIKLTGKRVICTLTFIIMHIKQFSFVILWSFFSWKYFVHHFKSLFCRALWSPTSSESFHSHVLSEIDIIYPSKESEYKDAECIFFNEKFSDDERRKIWIKCFSCSEWGHLNCTAAEIA